ncbi:diguanylate cyclase [Jiella sp. MQZ9-1]|uniref:diguanylate cyclase n=1 Tax=Jiella flava TaxID=2816857 RepID=A0A939JWJ4_9HYPH|nr:diguanylate cyclase [Jiella flava]MBO0663574.1 diguanylate cyclase [Jiella flava]MCD2472150.1 diguanylate cyclase [Jiella flava]
MDLVEVEQLISGRAYRGPFPPEIEAAYDAYRLRYRRRLIQALIVPSLVCYNVFLVVDYVLLPATFWLSVAIHLLFVSPIIVVSSLGLRDRWSLRKRDLCVALGPLAICAQIMVIYTLNTGSAAQHYQYLAILVLMYMNLLFRIEYDQAIIASAVALLIYVSALLIARAPVPVLVVGIMAVAATAYLSLSCNLQMQRDARHGFLRRLQEQLRFESAQTAAERDALTGLYNRRRLDTAFARICNAETDEFAAILMIDVDHFKRFNDENGHLTGDQCLRRVARVLLDAVRSKDDLVIRFGGEEFLILLPATSLAEALMIAERIRCEVEQLTILHADGATRVTVSIGAMASRLRPGMQDSLIADADRALYEAKQAGRNRVWPSLS